MINSRFRNDLEDESNIEDNWDHPIIPENNDASNDALEQPRKLQVPTPELPVQRRNNEESIHQQDEPTPIQEEPKRSVIEDDPEPTPLRISTRKKC